MSASADESDETLRVLVVARHPFTIDDLGVAGLPDLATIHLIRRPAALPVALAEVDPTVVVVDTAYPDTRGTEAIAETLATAPRARVLALTPSPAPHAEVALAVRAGASGFVDVDADPEDFVAAIRATHRGELWLPEAEVRSVLGSMADDLQITAAERRSRLTSIVVGLIPLMGAIATIMSLLWRRYLAHIGVRPVDLAIDPSTRVIDAIAAISILLGIIGPLLFVGSWLDLFERARNTPIRRRRFTWLIVACVWLATAGALTAFADLVLMVFVGPIVALALIARMLDLQDELPSVLRVTRIEPRRAFGGGLIVAVLLLSALSTEVLLAGPDFHGGGVDGVLAPRVLGFRAQPMRAFDVDGNRPPLDLLYLGGNADLYVLVDPCDDDRVDFVAVGATRLEVIDEVRCTTSSLTEG